MSPMKIRAVEVTGRDLKPGDLFSTMGLLYWEYVDTRESIGERVYIRTNTPSVHAKDADAIVYRIEIEK
jgi:hypothetical protein